MIYQAKSFSSLNLIILYHCKLNIIAFCLPSNLRTENCCTPMIQHPWISSNTATKTETKPTIKTTTKITEIALDLTHQSQTVTRLCFAHPVSFVNHLLMFSQQPPCRGHTDRVLSQAPSHPSVQSTCMGPQPLGPCSGWRLKRWGVQCCRLPQHGVLMLMDSHRSPG